MAIKIPVSAEFDSGQAEQQIQQFQQKLNALGQQIANTNKVQFSPVSKTTVSDLKKVHDQFVALQKISGDLRKRMTATGQSGASFVDVDWSKLYPDAGSRSRQMAKAFTYVTGSQFGPGNVPGAGGPGGGSRQPPPPSGGGGGGGGGNSGGGGGGWTQAGGGIAQSALRGAGPAGGVAANALGTGMSSGFGAGLMGLFGGMLALGVGKIVSGVTEKVGQAEDNNVAYDKLKRTLGDVNVSFTGLKEVLKAAADNTRITYAETTKLGQQFVKLGNITSDQYKTLGSELETGIGFSRSYGMEPEQGVAAFGQARGVGFAKSEQDTRRFALLIGETIGKAGAFAKADEVMDALSNYTTTQTRQSLGAANAAGFAGTFSALSGSGIAGLDPAGTSALMAKINATLSAGGAKGEASQFFTNTVGQKMGLNSIQTQIMREGGAFATNDEAFGEGSIAKRFGIGGPGGNQTFLQGSLDELRRQYGGNKGQLAQATANHLGVGMRQAMALLSVKPNEMGDMQQYADLTKLSGSGIGNLSKVLYGSNSDRGAVADSLRRRTGSDALSAPESAKLDEAMKSGNVETQKKVLAELVASRDQERTTGSDIRDSKNILDNIKTSLADKLVPLTQEIRHGIMNIAGAGKGKSPDEIMKEVINAESKGRQDSIAGKQDKVISDLLVKRQELGLKTMTGKDAIIAAYHDKPEIMEKKLKEREDNLVELAKIEKQLVVVQKEKDRLLAEENERRKQEILKMQKSSDERYLAEKAAKAAEEAAAAGIGNGAAGAGGGGGGGGSAADRRFSTNASVPKAAAGAVGDAMQFFLQKGWTKEQASGIVANLTAESSMRHGITGDNGSAYGLAQWHPDRQANFAKWAGKDIKKSTFKEQLGFVHYEMTEGKEQAAGERLRRAKTASESGDVVSRYYERPKAADADAAHRSRLAEKIKLTPLPDDAAAEAKREANRAAQYGKITVEPLTVVHENNKGEQVKPTQQLATTVTPAKPFGSGR